MTIARTLALALATAALVVPTAQAMPVEPVNAPGATAVDSASVTEQDLRHMSAGGDVRLLAEPSPAPAVPAAGDDDAPGLLAGIVAAAALAAVATAALVQRRHRTATT
jgi:hypothetical protein